MRQLSRAKTQRKYEANLFDTAPGGISSHLHAMNKPEVTVLSSFGVAGESDAYVINDLRRAIGLPTHSGWLSIRYFVVSPVEWMRRSSHILARFSGGTAPVKAL